MSYLRSFVKARLSHSQILGNCDFSWVGPYIFMRWATVLGRHGGPSAVWLKLRQPSIHNIDAMSGHPGKVWRLHVQTPGHTWNRGQYVPIRANTGDTLAVVASWSLCCSPGPAIAPRHTPSWSKLLAQVIIYPALRECRVTRMIPWGWPQSQFLLSFTYFERMPRDMLPWDCSSWKFL